MIVNGETSHILTFAERTCTSRMTANMGDTMSICTKNPTQLTTVLSGAGAKHAFQVKGLRLFMMLCFAIAGLAVSAPSAQAQVTCPATTFDGGTVTANSDTGTCTAALIPPGTRYYSCKFNTVLYLRYDCSTRTLQLY